LIACVWGNCGRGRGVSCLPITFDYQKGHKAPPISNRMSPFRSFYDNSFHTKCPGLKKPKNNTLCQHLSFLRQRYWTANESNVYFELN
jgi:hypothetical protein